jgi:two-component system, OmpR family, response regulator
VFFSKAQVEPTGSHARGHERRDVRVLVVEDEKRLAAGLKKGLEAEGFATDIALNGTDGLWMARENPYDAIVLDIMLPGMNGYQVCATLREDEVWTPILMLTAKDGEFDEAEALNTGADDYVTKPFSFVVLVARLRSLIRRGAGERPAVLEAGDLGFDPGSRQAWRGEIKVDLTAREMALLEFLLRRKGEVVSKGAILDHVWDYDFEGDSNIVEVYVGHLRNKLDRPFGRGALETVRGVGYRLAADGG